MRKKRIGSNRFSNLLYNIEMFRTGYLENWYNFFDWENIF